jgi:hypothetical protein
MISTRGGGFIASKRVLLGSKASGVDGERLGVARKLLERCWSTKAALLGRCWVAAGGAGHFYLRGLDLAVIMGGKGRCSHGYITSGIPHGGSPGPPPALPPPFWEIPPRVSAWGDSLRDPRGELPEGSSFRVPPWGVPQRDRPGNGGSPWGSRNGILIWGPSRDRPVGPNGGPPW